MENSDAVKIIEAVLFISDKPVPIGDLVEIVDGFDKEKIGICVGELNQKLEDHAVEVVEIAEGYQVRTKQEYGEWVKKFHKIERATRLSPASLEVLSIIAYKQPITRQEIEDIRGVDSSGIVKKLLEKSLIKSMGRKKLPGKPMAFGTTKRFLEYFGLVKLSDLPTLKDFPENMESGSAQTSMEFDDEPQEKDESDIQMEKEAAMIEPANEDYEDDEDEETQEFDAEQSNEEETVRVNSNENDEEFDEEEKDD